MYVRRDGATMPSPMDLMPHQADAELRFADSDQLALFLDMRLGKTLVAARWLKARGYSNPLILAPLSAHQGWEDTFDPSQPRTLLTYQKLVRNPGMATEGWDAVVLDESTMVKSPRSKVSKLVLRILSKVRGRAILTGIPAPEKLLDTYMQMAFLRGGAFMGQSTFWGWRKKFFTQAGYDWLPRRGVFEAVQAEMHLSGPFLSRREAGVGQEKVYVRIVHPLPAEARAEVLSLSRRWRLTNGVETKYAPVVVAWEHRACGGHAKPERELACWKYDEVQRLHREHARLVVWCAYSLELRRAFRHLKAAGVSVSFIQGTTSKRVREERRQRFFSARRMVLLIQPGCARFGADYSCADAAVYLSSPWSHETRKQSEDRVVHPMKTGFVPIYDLVNEDSVDEDVLEALALKVELTEYLAQKTSVQGKLRPV